ncbi:hypothetical protein D3C81_1818070 [compost metagenome]
MLWIAGDANARFDVKVVAIEAHWLHQDLADFFRHAVSIFRNLHAVQQHDKFIAANSGHGVGFPHAAF